MKYFFFLIFFFNFFFGNYIYSFESYVVLKVNNKIITNIDIDNEYRYLIALNTNLRNMDKKKVISIFDTIEDDSLNREDILGQIFHMTFAYPDMIPTQYYKNPFSLSDSDIWIVGNK